jgi:ATP-dependent Lon protease
MSIQAGCILRANGGYLILDASDLLSESGAWKVLVRTLSSGMLESMPPELGGAAQVQSWKPEPIPVEVRVILVGNVKTYKALDQNDDDFGDLFKVLVDFDSTLGRDKEAAMHYAGVLARLAEKESLPHFARGAVQAMVEYGGRLTDQPQRLTSHFTKIEDTAREAAFLSQRDGKDRVHRRHVTNAIARARRRADLPARRYRALLEGGTYNVETRGRVVGQVNGLATHRAGQITYGFPARLTASVGSGIRGIIDIESQASLSGSFHTKGVQILDGLLRHLLRSQHPIRFTASLAFEQSYGNIDGDSASGAEICCLLSGLAQVPIDQGIAMTGSIDQRGRVQAVGGANDKIEGFFDVCADSGLTGKQGVIIPQANVGDLMLREDIVEACRKSRFRVFAVDWINQALEILTGMQAGVWEEPEGFPSGSILYLARQRAHQYWMQSSRELQRSAEEGEAY